MSERTEKGQAVAFLGDQLVAQVAYRPSAGASEKTPFAEIDRLGYSRVRLMVDWADLEPSEDAYSTAGVGELVRWAKRRSIEVWVCLSGSHSVHTDSLPGGPRKKKAIKALGRAIKALKHEIGGQGVVWEIWDGPTDFESYVRLHERAISILADPKSPELVAGPSLGTFDLAFLERCIRADLHQNWHAVAMAAPIGNQSRRLVEDIARLRAMVGDEKNLWLFDAEQDPLRRALTHFSVGVAATVVESNFDRRKFDRVSDAVRGCPFLGQLARDDRDSQALIFGSPKELRMVAWTDGGNEIPVQWPLREMVVRSSPTRRVTAEPEVFVASPASGAGSHRFEAMDVITPMANAHDCDRWARRIGICEDSVTDLKARIQSLGAEPFWFEAKSCRGVSLARQTLIVPPPAIETGIIVTRNGWGVAINSRGRQSLAVDLDVTRGRSTSSTCFRVQEDSGFASVLAESMRPHQHDLLQIRSIVGTGPEAHAQARNGQSDRLRVAYPRELDLLTADYEGSAGIPKARWVVPAEGFREEKLVYEVAYDVAPGRSLRVQPSPGDRSRQFSEVLGFGLLVCGDGSGAMLRMQIRDRDDETFELTYGRVDWEGWRYVRFDLSTDRYWGGDRDGVIDWPVRYEAIAVLDAEQGSVQGTVQIACPTVLVAP